MVKKTLMIKPRNGKEAVSTKLLVILFIHIGLKMFMGKKLKKLTIIKAKIKVL